MYRSVGEREIFGLPSEIRFYILQYQFKQTKQLSNVIVLSGRLTALLEYFHNLQIDAAIQILLA